MELRLSIICLLCTRGDGGLLIMQWLMSNGCGKKSITEIGMSVTRACKPTNFKIASVSNFIQN
jgi:hypothetical protein